MGSNLDVGSIALFSILGTRFHGSQTCLPTQFRWHTMRLRQSRTGRYLLDPAMTDGTTVRPGPPPDDPGFLHRLSWRAGPRVLTDWSAVVSTIQSEDDLVVFCDTSVFDDTAPEALWDALLCSSGRMALTPRVWLELRGWLRRRQTHKVVAAIRAHSPAIAIHNEPKEGEPGHRAFDYYLALLAQRRGRAAMARSTFRETHGREPNDAEMATLLDDIQRRFGERGRLLAAKPLGNLTDESLVYLALLHAVTTGRQTMVLTRDADVEEQFFKLLWLVEYHYRGMLLANYYLDNMGTLSTCPVPASLLGDPRGPFEPGDAFFIEYDPHMKGLLPQRPRFVAISCWTVGTYMSCLSYGAEVEMRRLLDVKDRTGGLSTDRFGDRNVHSTVPSPSGAGNHHFGAVARDRRQVVSPQGASIARLDLYLALRTPERFSRIVIEPRKWWFQFGRQRLWVPGR